MAVRKRRREQRERGHRAGDPQGRVPVVTPEQLGPVTDGVNETTAVVHPTPLPSARMSVLDVHRSAVREKRRQRRDRRAAAAAATPGPVADVRLTAQHAPAVDVDDAAAGDQPPMQERDSPSPALKAFEAA
ncbi:unnamed protein product [Ectocarpus sp. 4 AP-2014]